MSKTDDNLYPIGTPKQKWDESDISCWRAKQAIKRSYQGEVINKIVLLKDTFDVEQYGALSYDEAKYPLFAVKSKLWQKNLKTILITGGVHGYETSGVHGAIRFLETQAQAYSQKFNIVVIPCVSPWGYETINRWNPNAVDPNRSFYQSSPAQESVALMAYIKALKVDVFAHFDLHETTDSDNSEFRPALAARDATVHDIWNIPDGFYLVGNTPNPMPEFQQAMIKAVEKITHIAPGDENNRLIGEPLEQWGVINYAARELGLCMGFTDAKYVTTTEMYPDSPKTDDENCILAQVACITGGLEYILQVEG